MTIHTHSTKILQRIILTISAKIYRERNLFYILFHSFKLIPIEIYFLRRQKNDIQGDLVHHARQSFPLRYYLRKQRLKFAELPFRDGPGAIFRGAASVSRLIYLRLALRTVGDEF